MTKYYSARLFILDSWVVLFAPLAQLVEHRSPKSMEWVRVLHGVPYFNSLEFDTFKTTNIGMDLAPRIELHT